MKWYKLPLDEGEVLKCGMCGRKLKDGEVAHLQVGLYVDKEMGPDEVDKILCTTCKEALL